MKVSVFQQAPYRFLPSGFEDLGIPSVVRTPYRQLVEAGVMFDSYRWFMDELLAGLRLGFDGVAVTEHGQASYDMVPNPNLPAAVLANAIRSERPEAALIVIGRSLGKTREPLRIAEEYAMLDVLSGGRLVAGLPVGLSYDANLNNGIPTVETRDRYREAVELMFRSWAADEPFTWNGRFSQYSLVNSWPRPLQQPRPPVWVPGSGSPGTMQWTLDQDFAFVYLGWFGATLSAQRIMDRFWDLVDHNGLPANSYRVGFVQNVVVSESDERAEVDYGRHVENGFRQGIGSLPGHYMGLPGYLDPRGLETLLRDPGDLGLAAELPHVTFGRLAEARSVIAGSPATVRDQILDMARRLRIGNLLVMLQMGGMPHDLTMKNMHLFADEVLPGLRPLWDDDGWENSWWPTGLPAPAAAT
jgi:alkanesulfonate monooxygenase SsuD/methylene tetrahydromethanopterin reductase-like flavin-dependent oxidoreductase (luciferase family)